MAKYTNIWAKVFFLQERIVLNSLILNTMSSMSVYESLVHESICDRTDYARLCYFIWFNPVLGPEEW